MNQIALKIQDDFSYKFLSSLDMLPKDKTNNQHQTSRLSADNTISPYNRRLIIVGDQ